MQRTKFHGLFSLNLCIKTISNIPPWACWHSRKRSARDIAKDHDYFKVITQEKFIDIILSARNEVLNRQKEKRKLHMEPHKVDFEMGEKVTAFVARDFSRAGTYGGLRINEISGIASGPEIVLFDTKLETLSVEKKDGLWKVTDHRQDSDHFISFAWDRATIAEDVKSYLKEKTDQLKEMEKQFKAFAVSSPDTGHP